MGSQAVDWPSEPIRLNGTLQVSGKALASEPVSKSGTVLIFVATECPIANRYAPEIKRITSEYSAKGFAFFRVYMEPLENAKQVMDHTKAFSYAMPALLDPNKKLVRASGARVTPEAVVLDISGRLLYRGRIDDQNIEHGKVRPNYRRDLRIALNEILAGKSVTIKSTAAVGCFIGPG